MGAWTKDQFERVVTKEIQMGLEARGYGGRFWPTRGKSITMRTFFAENVEQENCWTHDERQLIAFLRRCLLSVYHQG